MYHTWINAIVTCLQNYKATLSQFCIHRDIRRSLSLQKSLVRYGMTKELLYSNTWYRKARFWRRDTRFV